jgi:predicted nucleic acid-binding protein
MILEQLREAQFALDNGLTTYDASYLQLARGLGVPLINFDRPLDEAARRFGADSRET